jgi:uncharacterized protein
MAGERSFLGAGWSFPPRFSRGGAEVEMVSGAEDIHQSLQILLGTQLGERVMQDQFGCDLGGMLFEEIDQGLINRVTALVSDAILYHEPRIKLHGLDISQDSSWHGLLLIRIDYAVRGTNSRYNMVYPFYLYEAPGLG